MCGPKRRNTAPMAPVSGLLGVDFETALAGRHAVMNLLAAIAVARVFGIAPERLREPVRTFAVGKMRGERIEHNGIVVWNDCYNSNPEAAQSMIDVLRADARRQAHCRFGRNAGIGARGRKSCIAQVGRYAAEHGVDWLIGIARACPLDGGSGSRRRASARRRRTSSKIPPRRGISRGRRRGRAMRSCSRVPAACAWSGRWKGSRWPCKSSRCSTIFSTNSSTDTPARSASSATPPSGRPLPASRRCSCALRWGPG